MPSNQAIHTMKILLNYDYSVYPFTTASYIEMAAKKMPGVEVYHLGEIALADVDLIINIMPFDAIVFHDGVPSCFWEIDNHMIQGKMTFYYSKVDKIYVGQRHFIDLYPKGKTDVLPMACDPELHTRLGYEPGEYDIGFIGNASYPDRRTLLEQLSLKYKVLWTNSEPGIPYSQALSNCKMIFNRSLKHDVNMRFFEAMAIGRLLVTDDLEEQREYAIPGLHFVQYKDWKELDSQVHYYLDHEFMRETIAKTGRKHVRENHTYAHRLKKILIDFKLM